MLFIGNKKEEDGGTKAFYRGWSSEKLSGHCPTPPAAGFLMKCFCVDIMDLEHSFIQALVLQVCLTEPQGLLDRAL